MKVKLFIHISSIAPFKLFLIAWLQDFLHSFGQFRGQLEILTLANIGTILPKNHVLLSNFFPSSNMFSIRLFLANTKKKTGGHRARLIEKEHLFRYRA